MPAYAYIRVSTERQYESTRGIRGYVESALKYAHAYDLDLGAESEVTILQETIQSRQNVIVEEAVSASKTRLADRPMGRWLAEAIRPGDTVIFPRLSRGFRNVRDCLETVETWEAIGIHVVFLDCPVQGKAMLALFAAFAEWESEARSERVRSSHRASRLMGRPQKRHPDPGFTWRGTGASRRMVPCPKSLAIMTAIQQLRADGLSYDDIALNFIKNRVHKEPWGNGNLDFDQALVRKWEAAKKRIDQIEEETGIKAVDYDQEWLDSYHRLVAERDEQRADAKKRRAQAAAWKNYQKQLKGKA